MGATLQTWRLASQSAMWQVARELATRLRPRGGVLALYGDLGAGKTTLVQGLAAALGYDRPVTSPTFALVLEYPLPGGGCLVHMDLYRLQGPDDLDAIGFDEYVESGAIIAIEWADRAGDRLPAGTLHLRIERLGDAAATRCLTLACHPLPLPRRPSLDVPVP
jgi:tRNA threonylcarbamoyladenosine biosynthesis protein TsaE